MLTRIIISSIIGIILSVLVVVPLNAQRSFGAILNNEQAIINQKDRGITLYDRNGRSFFHFYEAKSKKIVHVNELPDYIPKAIIAIEDKTFYQHFGISPQGILRAALANIQAHKIVYGGSTITQQVIKNTLLTPQKSWLRKYQEAFLALELELRYTKPQIMEMYLNTAYFGEGAFGIEEAAQTYFQKPAKDLTLSETSLLVGLVTQPSDLSPLSHDPKEAVIRQHLVLQNMVESGFITLEQKGTAQNTPLTFNTSPIARNADAPHFALYVRDQLNALYGEPYVAQSGLKVFTTLDMNIQRQAEEALSEQLLNLKNRKASNGAVVVIDPKTHQILAMVGSKGWFTDKFGNVNMATSPRQTGSAFKPIVYAAGFANNVITPATILQDKPTTFGTDYRPQDYDGRFRGPVTVRRALANSLNVPAVSVMSQVGVKAVATLAQSLGITSLSEAKDYNLALALGAGEISLTQLTNSYATLANNGEYLPAQSILGILDKQNESVALTKEDPTPVVSPEVAFLVSSILSDNRARAEVFGNTLTIDRPAAVKTGTSQDYRDAWTVGYTPQLTVGVWVGNNDNTAMTQTAGALGAAPIWKKVMQTTLANQEIASFLPPQNITTATLCHYKHTEDDQIQTIAYQEYFVSGSEPQKKCFKTATLPQVQLAQTITTKQ